MWSEIVQVEVIEGDPDMLYFNYSYDNDYKKCKFKTISWNEQNNKETKASHQQRRKIY